MQFLILLHETAVKHVLKNWKFRHSHKFCTTLRVFTIHFPLQCTIIIKVNQYWLHKTNPPFVDFYTLIETRLIWATVLKRRSKIHRERKLYFYRLSEFCERRIGEALQKTGSSLKHSESRKIKNETNLKFYFSFRFCHIFFQLSQKTLRFYTASAIACGCVTSRRSWLWLPWKRNENSAGQFLLWKALARKNKSTQYGNCKINR